MNKFNLIFCCGMAFGLVACASVEKAALNTDDPTLAVAEVSELMREAESEQSDLLSLDEYLKGAKHLAVAQKGLSSVSQPDHILDNTAIAKTYFLVALNNSKERKGSVTRMLQARKSSIQAGLKNSEALLDDLVDVDDDLRDETDNFTEFLEPEEFSEFQKMYFSLEIRAVQFRELDSVKTVIQKSSRQDAEDLAPNTLRTAMLDVNEAENFIAQSPRAPAIHMNSVDRAIASSILLADVMDVILKAEGTPENIALKIVYQERELEKLSKNVGSLEKNLLATKSYLLETEDTLKTQEEELKSTRSNLQETESELLLQNQELESKNQESVFTQSNLQQPESALLLQNQELEKSSIQIRFQKAMDQAVEQFSEDEASVYQQSGKLIFRLKKINFASGSSTVPEQSKSLLSKVDQIIKSLGAQLVAVQGHTDSVGSADLNKKLSNKRAQSVATYLGSLSGGYQIGYFGYGESRPIASNETKEGRAINRRVDLVVTARK